MTVFESVGQRIDQRRVVDRERRAGGRFDVQRQIVAARIDRRDTGAKTLGIVLNRVPTSGAGAVHYGYHYRGDYYTSHHSKVPDQHDEDVVPEPVRIEPAEGGRFVDA